MHGGVEVGCAWWCVHACMQRGALARSPHVRLPAGNWLRAALDAGSVELVVAALRAHPEARDVQRRGCGALAEVASTSALPACCGRLLGSVPDPLLPLFAVAGAKLVAQHDALPVMFDMLRTHMDPSSTQLALWALHELCRLGACGCCACSPARLLTCRGRGRSGVIGKGGRHVLG